jgi:hypothetical protein
MPTKTARCHNCHTPALLSNHLCDACVRLQEARQQAFAYVKVINSMISDLDAFWLVSDMLNRLVLRSGMAAPMILQAVKDQAEWMSEITYPALCEVARSEVKALGLEIGVA